ncbi:MAG: hypothetical protein ACKOWO_04390 [Sediminibacterium sp.]
MPRLLFILFIASLMACESNSNAPLDQVSASFQQKRHDTALDQTIQPLLNQYFAVIGNLGEQDTANLQLHGSILIKLSDSLTKQQLSKDTITQRNALQGLMNIQFEMEAILLESTVGERIFGAQMLSLHWIEFLAAIGYQKQTIYIFSDSDGNQWMGLNKQSMNPYQQNDPSKYNANQVLQELK